MEVYRLVWSAYHLLWRESCSEDRLCLLFHHNQGFQNLRLRQPDIPGHSLQQHDTPTQMFLATIILGFQTTLRIQGKPILATGLNL